MTLTESAKPTQRELEYMRFRLGIALCEAYEAWLDEPCVNMSIEITRRDVQQLTARGTWDTAWAALGTFYRHWKALT